MRESVPHGKGRPSTVFMEFLARVSPIGSLVGDFAIDLTAFAGRKIPAREVLDMVIEARERGFGVETQTTLGVTKIFAPSHAMPAIRRVAEKYVDRTEAMA